MDIPWRREAHLAARRRPRFSGVRGLQEGSRDDLGLQGRSQGLHWRSRSRHEGAARSRLVPRQRLP